MKKQNGLLAIPNGSLQENTLAMLKKLGIQVPNPGRKIEVNIAGNEIFSKLSCMRPLLAIELTECAIAKACLIGKDRYEERVSKTKVVCELDFGRAGFKPVQLIVFGKKPFADTKSTKVLTENIALTRRVFKNARLTYSEGSTETGVYFNRYDFGVCVTETGTSIKENKLRILKTVLVSPVLLVAKEKTPELVFFGQQLQGALKAELFQLLKFNLPPEKLKSVLQIIPSVEAPTICNLADGNLAIETVAPKTGISNLILKIQKLGGNGILIQDFNILS